MNKNTAKTLVAASLSLALAGCAGYVKRTDFDAAMSELRSRDAAQQAQIDGLSSEMAQLKSQLQERFARYDKAIAEAAGKLRIDSGAHFAYDSAEIRAEDKPALDDFARVIREHHPGTLVTAEGFTDVAGSADYNRRLGQRRAEAVRDYLVAQGLSASQVRAVSYGQAANRLVKPGAWGENGEPNRRVALVIDRVGG
jgi:peptidoglycan-associated lipoprotein